MTALRPIWLLIVLLAWTIPLAAEPLDVRPVLNQQSIVAVTGTALAYMAPRTLEAHLTGQLAIWGLRGITTLDSRLVAEWSPTTNPAILRLSLGGKLLASLPPPPQGDAEAWGQAIGQLSRSAWDASEPVRRAGTQGILRSFFDELFNHLDPYSRYVSPSDAEADDNRRNGRAGIGIELGRSAAGFVVRKITPGSPAADAGIRTGELVLEIDGEPLDGADLPAVTALMAGPEGTLISLTLRAPGGAPGSAPGSARKRAPRSVDLVRNLITPPTVFAQRQGDLVIIRIASFSRDTADALTHELDRLLTANRPARGLVIDLRGNRGGLVRSAVDAADSMLAQGVIATTAGRDPDAVHEYRADAIDVSYGLPIVVIVDGRTASAAEVLAAALADQRRAVVIGSATLGKGLVQTILPLPDGGALSLTWSRILAPLGWPLQALGVLPQVCTSLGEETLKRQLAELVQGRQPMARALTHHREARAPLSPSDILEIRNACPASEGRDQDVSTAKYLIETPAAYGAALIPQPASP